MGSSNAMGRTAFKLKARQKGILSIDVLQMVRYPHRILGLSFGSIYFGLKVIYDSSINQIGFPFGLGLDNRTVMNLNVLFLTKFPKGVVIELLTVISY